MTVRELAAHLEGSSPGLGAQLQQRADWTGGRERVPKADVAWQLIAEVIPDARLTGCNGRPVPPIVDRAMYLIDGGMPLEHAADQIGLEPEALRRMIEHLEPALLEPCASPREKRQSRSGPGPGARAAADRQRGH